MIAIGTGLFAGLSSLTHWRLASNEASLALTNMYDLRAEPSGASFLPRGALAAIAHGVEGVAVAEERLIVRTQVEADAPDGARVFVPGRIVGVDLAGGGPHVNAVEAYAGRPLGDADVGEPVVLLERNFAAFHELPERGRLRLGGGGATVDYVGHGVSPEYFLVVEQGNFYAQANLAVVFTSLETAQDLAGRAGMVNDLVLTVEEGVALGPGRGGPDRPDGGASSRGRHRPDAPRGRCVLPRAHPAIRRAISSSTPSSHWSSSPARRSRR